MRRAFRIAAIVTLSLFVAACIAFVLLLRSNFAREKIREIIVSSLSGMTDGVVRIDRVSGGLLGDLTLIGIEIRESDGSPFLAIDTVTARYAIFQLLRRNFVIRDIRIVRPTVVLDRRTGGKWNYERIFRLPKDTTGAATATRSLVRLDRVTLADATFTLRTPWAPDSSLSGAERERAIATAISDDFLLRVEPAGASWQLVQQYAGVNAAIPTMRLQHPVENSILFVVDSLSGTAGLFRGDAIAVRQLSGEVEIKSDSLLLRGARLHLAGSAFSADVGLLLPVGDISAQVQADSVSGTDLRSVFRTIPADLRGSFLLDFTRKGSSTRYQVRELRALLSDASVEGDLDMTMDDATFRNAPVTVDLTFGGVNTALIRRLAPDAADRLPGEATLSGTLVASGTLADATVDAELLLSDSVSGESRVNLRGGAGWTDRMALRELNVNAFPAQVALMQNFNSTFPLDGQLSGNALLNGVIGDSVSAELDLEYVDDGSVSRVNGSAAVVQDSVPRLNWKLTVDPIDLAIVAEFLPDSGPDIRGSAAGSIVLDGPLSALALGLELSLTGGGSVTAVGVVDAHSADIAYDLDVRTEGFNIASVVAGAAETSINSVSHLKGSGVDPARLTADLDVALRQSLFDDVTLDSARTVGRLAAGVLEVDTLFARLGGASASGSGALGITDSTSGTLQLTVAVDSLATFSRWIPHDTTLLQPSAARIADAYRIARADSARIARETEVQRALTGAPPPELKVNLPQAIPADSVAGRAHFSGTLSGNPVHLALAGELNASAIVAAGVTVDTVHAVIAGTLLPRDSLGLSADLRATDATAFGFAIDSIAAEGTWHGTVATLLVEVHQGDAEHYKARVAAAFTQDSTTLDISDVDLRFDSTTTWRSRYPSRLAFSSDVIQVDSLELVADSVGFVRVAGRLGSAAGDSLDVGIFGLQVKHLLDISQSDINASGVLSAGFRFSGSLDTPVFSGAAGFRDGTLGENPLPEMHATFEYSGGILTTDLLASEDLGESFARGSGRIPFSLGRTPVAGMRDSALSARFELDGVPLDLVPSFNANVSRLSGRLTGELDVSGTAAEPVVRGDVTIAEGGAYIDALGVQLDSIGAHLVMENDTLVVERFTARSGGPLELTGGIGLAKLSEPTFDLTLSANTVYVMNNENGRLRADTLDIRMRGPFRSTTIDGVVRILDGVLYIPDYTQKTVIATWDTLFLRVLDTTDARARELFVRPNQFMDNLVVGINLEVGRDTWVRSADANVELYSVGPLRVQMQRGGRVLHLEGVLSTERGQYKFLSKNFEIRRGSATFPAGSTEINPTLQIVGEHEVQLPARGTAHISVIIRGTMRRPEVRLESDAQPPLSQSDLLSYLAFGRSSGSLLQGASGLAPSGGGVQGVGKVAGQQLAGIAAGTILRELEREAEGAGMRSLGLDLLNISPAETYTEIAKGDVLSFLRQTDFEVGRYVTPHTFIAGQLRLSATPGVRVLHRSSKGFTIETSWEPRIVLREPTLLEQRSVTKRAFTLFFSREWRF